MASTKPIQEQFGETVIQAFADFARADLKQPADLVRDEFAHVHDPALRLAMAQVFYGVRWIYKLGLALLTRNEERAAHVRAQIVDYASVCEALLSYCIAHAVRYRYTVGTAYTRNRRGRINWSRGRPEKTVAYQDLRWLIRIAHQFGIINQSLADDVDWLRNQRNTVHLRARASIGRTAFLNQSRKAFQITTQVIEQTRTWKAMHPAK